jgi:hypothetical protein
VPYCEARDRSGEVVSKTVNSKILITYTTISLTRLSIKYKGNDQGKSGEMGRTYSTYCRDVKERKSWPKKSVGERLLGRSKHNFKDNIKLDLRETGCEVVEWV